MLRHFPVLRVLRILRIPPHFAHFRTCAFALFRICIYASAYLRIYAFLRMLRNLRRLFRTYAFSALLRIFRICAFPHLRICALLRIFRISAFAFSALLRILRICALAHLRISAFAHFRTCALSVALSHGRRIAVAHRTVAATESLTPSLSLLLSALARNTMS